MKLTEYWDDTVIRVRVEKKNIIAIQRTTGPHKRMIFILPVY